MKRLLHCFAFFFFITSCCLLLSKENHFELEDAKEYYDSSPTQFRFKAACEALEQSALRGDERVLDVGCGPGVITQVIAQKVPAGSVVGVDSSPAMIAVAKKMVEAKNATFEQCLVEDLLYKEEFDVVVSFTAFHWIKDKSKALKVLYESLKQGGRLFIFVPTPEPFRILYWIEKTMSLEKWRPYFQQGMPRHPAAYCSAQEYEAFLEKAGFSSWEVTEQTFTFVHPTPQEAFTSFFHIVPPMRRKVPEALQNEFIKDFLQEVLRDFPFQPDGSMPVASNVFVIKAVK